MPPRRLPTLAQLIELATRLCGCSLEEITVDDVLSGTVAEPVRVLTRDADGRTLEAILPNLAPTDPVLHEKLREIAADLELAVEALDPQRLSE